MSSMYESFGKYRLTGRLASGGMAEVYLGCIQGAAGFVKPVVIKRLHPRFSEDQEFVQMLIDEARITAQLIHTNICQVLDLGSVDGAYYIAMEFVSGEDVRTLQEHCLRRNMALPMEAAVHIMSEALAGLEYAHRKEDADRTPLAIIHRDVSPQNILVSYEGDVKIIDFGIAKARSRLVHTQTGIIKGKFRYMSPEQASGGKIDQRTDVFAAGVVLYELLRGAPHSLDLPDAEVLRRMRRADFEPLNQFRSDVPQALDAIVRRALQRRPRDRYQSAGEFRSALLQLLVGRNARYGRTEVACLMREIFDEARRRKRSGSLPGTAAGWSPEVGAGSSGVLAPEGRVPTDVEDAGSAASGRGGPARSRSSANDLALQAAAPGPAEHLPPDTQQTRAYTRPPQAPFAPVGDDSVPTTTRPGPRVGSAPVPVREESVPTAAAPPRRAAAAPGAPPPSARTASGAGASVREATEVVDQGPEEAAVVAPARAGERTARPETPLPRDEPLPPLAVNPLLERTEKDRISTGRTGHEAQPSAALRSVVGGAIVLVLGSALALALYLLDQPLPDPAAATKAATDLRAPSGRTVQEAGGPSPEVVAVLDLRSKPAGARIALCGEMTAFRTPATVKSAVGRRCRLEMTLEGYETYRQSLAPKAGPPIIIVATLRPRDPVRSDLSPPTKPRMGTLKVTSIQVGTVYVDGNAVGSTPRLLLPLSPGSYRVRMYFPALELQTRERVVTLQAGRTASVHFDPSP